jgi:hypothetical protein
MAGWLVALTLVLGACATAPAPEPTPDPATVLYYYDGFASGADDPFVADALAANGYDVTETTAVATFDAEVAGGGYDLVIALFQLNPPAVDLGELSDFVADGGRAIVADYSGDTTIESLFDATYTDNDNQASADLGVPALASGITDPIVLSSPGYTTWSMGLAAEPGATSLCTFGNGDSCMVEGNGGNTILLGWLADAMGDTADGLVFWQNLTSYLLD